MPRKSIAELSVVQPLIPERPRLKPPPNLSPKQHEIWRRTVDALPSNWFTAEHLPILLEYVRVCERADQIESMLSKTDDADQFEKLTRLGLAVATQINSFAKAMRLTQSSRLKAETAANHAGKGSARPGIEVLFDGR